MKHKDGNQGSTRRDFLGATVLGAGALLTSSAFMTTLAGCGKPVDWKPKFIKKFVLKNFRLFDGVSTGLRDGLAVLVKDGAIEDVVREKSLTMPEGYKEVDLKAMTLLPGLIDNHVHMTVPFMYHINLDAVRQMNDQLIMNFKSCIMGGVTTVRDMGGFPGKILKFRALADRKEIPGPRVISSLSPVAARKGKILGAPEKAPYFTNPVIKILLGGNYAERPETVGQIKEACLEMIGKGAQWLKTLHQDHSYSYHPRALPNHTDEGYRAILETGKLHGIKCALHEPLLSGFMKGVDLGFHTLEHMPLDGIIPDRYVEKFMNKNMVIHATLMAYGDVFVEEDLLELVEKKGTEFLVPEAVKQMKSELGVSVAQGKKNLSMEDRKKLVFDRQYLMDMHANQVANLRKLFRAGAKLGIGTDLGGYYCGFFGRYCDELQRFVAAGIPPADVLKMATSINAKTLGMDDAIGTITKGKKADMIAVEGNPLTQIKAMKTVRMVMKEGALYRDDV